MTDRSPISLFVAYSTEMHAETKISMLRMFYDCIDLASPESDGWQVHEWLKRAYAREKVPISQNSITWLLHLTANEQYVECSPRILWSALQHAVRSVLNHERYSRHFECLLQLSDGETRAISQRHLSAFGTWLALRVSARVLLPMVLYLGSFLQLKGFDWIEDFMSHRQFLQAQPNLYAAWCHAVLDAVERIEDYMREELDLSMLQLGWTRDDLMKALSDADAASYNSNDYNPSSQTCSQCKDDYSMMVHGLVEPARIAIQECVKTGHDFDCICRDIYKESDLAAELSDYTGACCDDYEDDESDIEEDFFDAQPDLFDLQSQPTCNMFSDVTTLLYRAQGRIWINSYAIGERLCATCFLFKEQYIGEDGFAAEFPPMPKSFEGFRTKW
jgi:succinate dehydrogenase hydrophobic anchor subunit